MSDAITVAAVLLVVGPLLGILGFYDGALYKVWAASREEHLAIVAAHRRGWIALNVGFVVATLATTSGLAVLALEVDVPATARAILASAVIAYALGGAMWCAVVTIRTRTTPLLGDLVEAGRPTEPAESLLGGALGALFAGFSLLTGLALVGMGIGLVIGGVVGPPVALVVAAAGLFFVAWLLRTGDLIPAAVYLPTIVLGVALVVGGAT